MRFHRAPLPERFCNLDRLLAAMRARNLDGLVVSTPLNLFYLSGFNGIAHKADEPRPYALILSREMPESPILVIADYYLGTFLSQPTWVRDIRPFRAVMMPLDVEPRRSDIDRFIPKKDAGWIRNAQEQYAFDMGTAMRKALCDLALGDRRIGFDDLGFAKRLGIDAADAYDALMFARAIKTPAEIDLLRRSTALNRTAIERTAAAWRKGMTWREVNRSYHMAAIELGGFVRDPGAMVWGHPRGADPALTLQTGLEDFAVEPGMHVMFDCHGTLDLYCWDGGKTWVVGGESTPAGKRNLGATAAVAEALLEAMRPGARVSELQSLARKTYGKAGVSEPDTAVSFFHGLGLSHWDIQDSDRDWKLEAGMVVPMHIVYPGGERERAWLEEVVHVTESGSEAFFGWGFAPL